MDGSIIGQVLVDPYNIAYFLTLLAYIIHQMLGLRLVLFGAHIGFLILSVIHHHLPGLFWNPLFIAINAYHIARILWDKRRIHFEPILEKMYTEVFSTFERSLMRTFWDMGRYERIDGNVLAEGHTPDRLMLIIGGTVVIEHDGKELSRLGPGRLVAEMGLLTGKPASATVKAPNGVEIQSWTYSVLQQVEHKDPGLWSRLLGILGKEMAKKIAESRPRR